MFNLTALKNVLKAPHVQKQLLEFALVLGAATIGALVASKLGPAEVIEAVVETSTEVL